MQSVQKKESRATSSGLDSPAGTKVAIVTGEGDFIMTPHQVELVQNSFNMVVPNLESAARTFTNGFSSLIRHGSKQQRSALWL
jgi:hypothetical protein